MRNWAYRAVLLVAVVGCGAPPEPTGPAAEAPTDDIQITVDAPTSQPAATAESTANSPSK